MCSLCGVFKSIGDAIVDYKAGCFLSYGKSLLGCCGSATFYKFFYIFLGINEGDFLFLILCQFLHTHPSRVEG